MTIPRKHMLVWVSLLLAAPLGALSLATWFHWSPTGAGRTLTATLAALGGAAGVAALVFALDAARIRRAFRHLRSGGSGLGWEPPERQRLRERRQIETVAQLRRQVEHLSAIRDLALIANDDVQLERILERALAVLGGLLDAREIAIFLAEKGELTPVAHRVGATSRIRGKRPLKVQPREAKAALEKRRTVVASAKGAGTRAASLLVADGQVMGALEVRMGRAPRGVSDDSAALARELEGLAKHIALAIRKPTLYDRAVVDSLTSLYTKRHFLEQAQQYMAQRARLGTPLSLIILDVDHFKQVNDVHGHVAGDLVLAEVARRLRQGVRAYDLAFRYGGEEMIVLSPNTPKEDAAGLAERLRRSLRRTKIDTGEAELQITASFGVAEYDPDVHADVAAFLGEADQCLYKAKRGGRDQVVSESDSDSESESDSVSESVSESDSDSDSDPVSDPTVGAQPAAPAESGWPEIDVSIDEDDDGRSPHDSGPTTVGDAFRRVA